MKKTSVRNFLQIVLSIIISFILVVLSFVFVENLIGVSLVIIIFNFIFLLYLLIKSVAAPIKHIRRRPKERFEFLYIFNFLIITGFSALVFALYAVIAFGALIILLPFLA